jgi:hypothetical protein
VIRKHVYHLINTELQEWLADKAKQARVKQLARQSDCNNTKRFD